MICSSSAGARSWACDGPAHPDHHGTGGGGGGGRRRGHLVPARVRAGARRTGIGVTARLVPFTVDGLIWAASMVVLDASRRGQPVPRLAAWSLGAGIVATVGANLAHGVGHGPVDALVSAWPALALVGSFELLMMLIRTGRGRRAEGCRGLKFGTSAAPPLAQDAPPELSAAPTLEQTDPRAVPGGPQPARHRPRPRHRPPQGQAHHRPRSLTRRRPIGTQGSRSQVWRRQTVLL